MAADDEFESFRGSIADLDHDRERRIRGTFEGLRGPIRPDELPSPEVGEVTQLRIATAPDEPSPNARHGRPVLVGVAAAVVLMVLIGAISLLRSSDDATDLASSVDDLPLSELATRAAARAAVAWPADSILHGDRRTGDRTAKVRERAETLTIANDEEWTRRDGTGKVWNSSEVIAIGPGTPFGTAGAAHYIEQNEPRPIRSVAGYDELQSLPTDPDDLLRFARASGMSGDDPADVADWLARMLSMEVVPPATRAGGFLALEQLGAQPVGQLTNYSGQASNAYRGVDNEQRPWVVLVDPVTTRVTGFAMRGGEGEALFSEAERWFEFGPQDFVNEMPN